MSANTAFQLQRQSDFTSVKFNAMASPCEFLFDSKDVILVGTLATTALKEIRRIEKKFSRYLDDNLCHAINHAEGNEVAIDEECYRLLRFAQTCYELSEGLFDLTSGVLRRVWKFDCSDRIPSSSQVEAVLPLVGWEKIRFEERILQMPAGMEIDFGGIAKEYAVNAAADLCHTNAPNLSVLINLGGDLQVTRPRQLGKVWRVGIENLGHALPIQQGALATSGDAKRYLVKNGKRYSHILNPKTGWPVLGAPSTVTIQAPLCVQAGCLATLALLQGTKAEAFLESQPVRYWCQRP